MQAARGAGGRGRGRRTAELVAVAGSVLCCVACADDRSTSSGPELAGATAGPGTALRDDLVVTDGLSLLGAVYESVGTMPVPDPAEVSWSAVLLVSGDPLDAWQAFVAQFPVGLNPQLAGNPAAGCATMNRDLSAPGCSTYAIAGSTARRRPFHLDMLTVPGDTTGHYLLRLDRAEDYRPEMVRPGDPVEDGLTLPPAPVGRAQPEVGDPLATTVDPRYVLLPGSEFVAQFGTGSLTGGFEVALRVSEGADVDEVAQAYAVQAGQSDMPQDTVRQEHTVGDIRYVELEPPGSAGGYAGYIHVVDQPGTATDYIYYRLLND